MDDLKTAIEYLQRAGAEGIWLVRGTKHAALGYLVEETDRDPLSIQIAPPHELIVVARFPAGDDKPAGIEYH